MSRPGKPPRFAWVVFIIAIILAVAAVFEARAQGDAALTKDVARSILDVGVIGAVCLLLIGGLIIRERYWLKREADQAAEFKATMKEERDAHEKTRAAHLTALMSNQSLLNVVNQHMQSQTLAVDAVLKAVGKEAA